MKLIERKTYLQKMINSMQVPDIKVITGIRRCGKSKLLDDFDNYLKLMKSTNIIRINLELRQFKSLLNPDNLYDYIENRYDENKENYLLIDEIQLCNGFEEIINSLHAEEKFNIYITGSNAFLLSSDLATLFGGRVFEIKIYPFSFKEYVEYYNPKDFDKAFNNYVIDGGMPGTYLYNNKNNQLDYLKGIFETTIIKDIVTKYKVENEQLLKMIGNFLMDNLGSKTSIRNIANKLTTSTYKTNDKTVGTYLDYICKSFLFYPLTRFDIKGKKYLESDKKYALVDTSFRYASIGTKDTDYGHLYENIVAIEFLRRGYEVYVGAMRDKEIDFVVLKNGYKTYIQVSDDISKEETFKREVNPLLSIKDAYPKILIARIKHPQFFHEGIRIIDIAEFLLDSQIY